MLIGIDFDNTIACYDRLFHRLAVERDLIPRDLACTKQAVRDHLRECGREDEWTELQGIAYGPRIIEAEPFPGVLDFLSRCRSEAIEVAIISHKSRHPYCGEQFDLHAAARSFLDARGFFATARTGLDPGRVYFERTLPSKLGRIRAAGCTAFVDDLPEVLCERDFPVEVRRVLFDPANRHSTDSRVIRVTSWFECAERLLCRREVAA
jgi:hypothetical protein